MKLSRANLAVFKMAAKDRGRYALHGIHVAPDGWTCGADGAVLMAVGPADADYVNMGGVQDIRPRQDCIIEASHAKEVFKSLDKNGPAHQQYAAVTDDNDETFTLSTTDLEVTRGYTVHKVEGQYPDWASIITGQDYTHAFTVNGQYLIDIGRAIKKATGATKGNPATVDVELPADSGAPVRFLAETETGQPIVCLVSPVIREADEIDPVDDYPYSIDGPQAPLKRKHFAALARLQEPEKKRWATPEVAALFRIGENRRCQKRAERRRQDIRDRLIAARAVDTVRAADAPDTPTPAVSTSAVAAFHVWGADTLTT